jgi:hypothetical protein
VHLNPRANQHTPPFKRRATIRCAGATAIAPKNQRKPEWVRAELIRLAALCGGSRRNVARLFNRLHGTRHGMTVGHSFTCELLKAHAVQVLRLRRELKSQTPAVVPICHTWAMDMTFYTDDANMTHASLGIIDHGSRALHLNGQTQLQAALDVFRLFYNHARTHSNLDHQTPAHVWQSQTQRFKKPRPKPHNTKPELVQAFDGLKCFDLKMRRCGFGTDSTIRWDFW